MKIKIPIADAILYCFCDITKSYKNVINKSVLPKLSGEPAGTGLPPVRKKITLKLLMLPINCVIRYGPVTNKM